MNRLKEHVWYAVNKTTGEKAARWVEPHSTERNAKTRYSYGLKKSEQYPNQTTDVIVQLVNPIKLREMIESFRGTNMTPDEMLDIIISEIDAT